MQQNITQADELESSTAEMSSNAQSFRQQSTELKYKMWLKNVRLWIIIGATLAVLLFIFIIIMVIVTAGGSDKKN